MTAGFKRGWSRAGGWLAVAAILLVLAHGVRQTQDKAIRNPNDFVTLYAGSICMTHACNPYRVPDLENVLEAKRGTEVKQDWSDQLPIYPPTTLALLLPMSLLPYRAATIAWYGLSLLIYASGLCWTFYVSPVRRDGGLGARTAVVLLGLYFPKMMQCAGFGNPAVIVTGLLLFGLFDEAESRRGLRYVAIGLACLLKPPMALPLAVVMLLRDHGGLRRVCTFAAALGGIALAVTLLAMQLHGMRNWRADLRNNIALGESLGMSPSLRGTASNAMLNVANLPGYFTEDARTISLVTLATVGAIGLCFAALLWRERRAGDLDRESYLLAIAAASALTLLPVYHRFCDIGVLLAAVPWVFRELGRRARSQALLCVPMLLLLYFSWERRVHLERFHGSLFSAVQFLYYRGDALLVLLLTCVLLWAMADDARRLRPSRA